MEIYALKRKPDIRHKAAKFCTRMCFYESINCFTCILGENHNRGFDKGWNSGHGNWF